MAVQRVVAIFLADPERSARFAAAIDSDRLKSVVATHADEFFQVVNFQPVDLIVLDQQLNGFMTGLELLQRLAKDLLRPPAILLSPPLKGIEAQAQRQGIQTVLPRDCDLDGFKAAVVKAVATSNGPTIAISREARVLAQECEAIRPLPQVLVKLLSYLDAEDASPAELARDISTDARITANLLRVSSSAAFSARRKFTAVSDAVAFLGIRRTVSLITAAALVDMQQGMGPKLPEAISAWYSRRSVLLASSGVAFARHLEGISTDTAQLLGLFQDIGILVLADAYCDKYCQLVERCRQIPLLRLELLETQEFKVNHAEVSAALLQRWAMPPSLISPVASHHATEIPDDRSPVEKAFLRVMRAGESLANLADTNSPQRLQRLTGMLTTYWPEKIAHCKSAIAESAAGAAEAAQLFSTPLPNEAELRALLSGVAQDLSALPPLECAPPEIPPHTHAGASRTKPAALTPIA